jgi:hypothetical protein
MADQQVITIPIQLPSSDEAVALAQFVKRIGYEDVNRFASPLHHLRRPVRGRCDVVRGLRAATRSGGSRVRAALIGGRPWWPASKSLPD